MQLVTRTLAGFPSAAKAWRPKMEREAATVWAFWVVIGLLVCVRVALLPEIPPG